MWLEKTIHIQKYLEEISDFSLDFLLSYFLSCFSSDNNYEEPIPYLKDTSLLNNDSYMTQLDAICKFNYNTGQGICTSHSFPITRSQAKLQNIAIPSIFKPSTGLVQRPSQLLC